MLLGIGLHAGLAYMTTVWDLWPVDDASGSWLFDLAFWWVHLFRMEVFFMMAGFFACLILARRGVGPFLRHRFKRLGLPLMIGMVTIIPICHVVWAVGLFIRYGDAPPATGDAETLTSWLRFLSPWHLWFLMQLLVMVVLAAAWSWVTARVRAAASVGAAIVAAWMAIVRWRLAAPALALATFPILLLQSGPGVDTQMTPWPPAPIVAYYLIYFIAGWMLYRRKEDLAWIARLWHVQLVVGSGLAMVYVMLLGALVEGKPVMTEARVVASLSTALLVVGFTGAFLRLFHRPSAVMRYLSDASYWMYIIHLPLVVVLNILLAPVAASALVKFAAVCLVSTALMLVSYQLGVRYTPMGTLLNGPRTRPG